MARLLGLFGVSLAVVGCGSTTIRTVTVTHTSTTRTATKPREMTSGSSTGMPTVNAFLGAHIQDLSGSMEADPHDPAERIAASRCQIPASRSGVLVEQVAAGSPAATAGLAGGSEVYSPPPRGGATRFVAFIGGDVITRVNGQRVQGLGTLDKVTEKMTTGERVKLTVLPCRGSERTVDVALVDGRQNSAIDQRLAAETPPSAADTPQPEASENTRQISRQTRDAILAATDVPRSEFNSFCVNAWASESDANFATYEISTNPSCASMSTSLGDDTTILRRQSDGVWRVVFTGTGPNTSCRGAPGIPAAVVDDFGGCPGRY